MPADDFRQLVTERTTEILVGGQNFPGKVEFYNGLGFGKRGKNRESIGTPIKKTHAQSSDVRQMIPYQNHSVILLLQY